ncbi:transmembrane amino acid transporter protein-domain-containing protein [Pelagophyceae sp. CCMP2097]|nr:transmembrane amino acid transporter protein-domain-containing protein [Pelagophyceae sp. CCMP2097]
MEFRAVADDEFRAVAEDDGGPVAEVPAAGRPATFASCVFNLANTIIGSGMLGLPAAFAACGYMLGSALLCLAATNAAFGLHLLAAAARLVERKVPGDAARSGTASFRSVATAAAPRFATLIDAAVAVKCFGVATSYLIVVGDTMPVVARAVVGPASALAHRAPWILGATALVGPLAFMRNLDSLQFASMFSLGCVLFLVVMIVQYYTKHPLSACDDEGCGDEVRAEVTMATARKFTIFIFSYTCHQNIFAVVNEIQRPSPRRINGVVCAAVGCAAAVYLAVANCGYASFGDAVRPDVLDNFPSSPVVNVARVLVALLVALSFPLQCHPSRACVRSLLRAARGAEATPDPLAPRHFSSLLRAARGAGPETASDDAAVNPLALRRLSDDGGADGGAEADGALIDDARAARRDRLEHCAVTAIFVGGALAIALSVEDLSAILAIVGATGSTTVSYILPGGIYARLAPRSLKRHLAVLLFAVGCVIMPTALVLIFI